MNVKTVSVIITVSVCFATVILGETVRDQNYNNHVQGISILLLFKWLLP